MAEAFPLDDEGWDEIRLAILKTGMQAEVDMFRYQRKRGKGRCKANNCRIFIAVGSLKLLPTQVAFAAFATLLHASVCIASRFIPNNMKRCGQADRWSITTRLAASWVSCYGSCTRMIRFPLGNGDRSIVPCLSGSKGEVFCG